MKICKQCSELFTPIDKRVVCHVKPLSVNEVWQGKRFKTKKYTEYEKALFLLLPSIEVPKGKLSISIHYGFSNSMSDIDNPCKPFLDILQKKYSFNDNMIYELIQTKEIVKKGSEFICFSIEIYKQKTKALNENRNLL